MLILQKGFILFSGYGREWKIYFRYWLDTYEAKEKWRISCLFKNKNDYIEDYIVKMTELNWKFYT